MKEIPLSGPSGRGRVALVDDEDYELVARYKWRPKKERHTTYAMTTIPGTRHDTIKMHQVIMGINGVDHQNGDGLDNRRSNLREATVSQNGMNRKRNQRPTVSGFKGVAWRKDRGKWFARIYLDYRQMYIGMYDTAEQAARAYDEAARKLFGEFARLNFPEQSGFVPPPPPVRRCARPDCGEEFQFRPAHAIYCSSRCTRLMSQRACRARQRAAA